MAIEGIRVREQFRCITQKEGTALHYEFVAPAYVLRVQNVECHFVRGH
jgi:hypothetical protein